MSQYNMGKNNNLKDFLKDVADAIRERKKIDTYINPQDFSSEILSIKGGGNGAIADNDIRFFDYDGTLLYSYTFEEAKTLEELPELPNHDGLICQGWNWDLEDIKALDYPMDIGAMYITNDGKTRIYITVPAGLSRGVQVNTVITRPNEITIDWGDGNKDYVSGSTDSYHIYNQDGSYIITLDAGEDILYSIRNNTGKAYPLTGQISCITKIELGKNVILESGAFRSTNHIETITIPEGTFFNGTLQFFEVNIKCLIIPKGVTVFDGSNNNKRLSVLSMPKGMVNVGALAGCSMLNKINFPETVQNISNLTSTPLEKFICPKDLTSFPTLNAPTLRFVEFNNKITTINYNAFYLSQVQTITLPESVTSIGNSSFKNMYLLNNINLSDNIERLENQSFYGCILLTKIKMPRALNSIGQNSMDQCLSLKYLDFTKCEQIPTLEDINAITIIEGLEIWVPNDLYVDWVKQDNWAELESYIIAKDRTE